MVREGEDLGGYIPSKAASGEGPQGLDGGAGPKEEGLLRP